MHQFGVKSRKGVNRPSFGGMWHCAPTLRVDCRAGAALSAQQSRGRNSGAMPRLRIGVFGVACERLDLAAQVRGQAGFDWRQTACGQGVLG